MNDSPIKDSYVYRYSNNITHNWISASYLTALSIERIYASCKPITYQTRKSFFQIFLNLFNTTFHWKLCKCIRCWKFSIEEWNYELLSDYRRQFYWVIRLWNAQFRMKDNLWNHFPTYHKNKYITVIIKNFLLVRTFWKSKNMTIKEEDDYDISNENEKCDGTNEGLALFLYTSLHWFIFFATPLYGYGLHLISLSYLNLFDDT